MNYYEQIQDLANSGKAASALTGNSEYSDYIQQLANQSSILGESTGVDSVGLSLYDQTLASFRGPDLPSSSMPATDISSQGNFASGVDQGQAMLWEGGNQFLQQLGFSGTDAQKYMEQQAKDNLILANQRPAETLWDNVARGFGTVAVGTAPTAAVAAGAGIIGAPVSLASALAGAFTGMGMNVGDASFKSKALDPDINLDAQATLQAAGLGAIEYAMPLRLLKGAKPFIDGTKQALSTSLKQAGGTVLMGGAIEGVQDVGTSLIAYDVTDTPITEETLESISEDALMEALVGSIITGPFAGGTLALNVATKGMESKWKPVLDEEGQPILDKDGLPTLEYNVPVSDVAKTPSLFKETLAKTLGRSPDRLALYYGSLPSFRKWMGGIVQNKAERARLVQEGAIDVKTLDWMSQIQHAELSSIIAPYRRFKKNPEILEEIDSLKRQGIRVHEDPDIQAGLESLYRLDTAVKEAAELAGIDKETNWRGDDFVPLMNANFVKIIKESEAFRAEAYADIEANTELKSKRKKKAKASVDRYIDNLITNGRYTYGNPNDTGNVTFLIEEVKEIAGLNGKPDQQRKRVKGLAGKMREGGSRSQARKDNPLSQERYLKDLTDGFWSNWTTDDKLGNYETYLKAVSNRLATAKQYGGNLENYWMQVADIVEEATQRGMVVPANHFKDFINISNIMQGLPTSRMSVRMAQLQEKAVAWQTINKLGLSLFPSIPESLFVFSKYGALGGLTQLGNLVMNRSKQASGLVFEDGTPFTIDQLLDDLGMSMHEATNIAMNRFADDTHNPGRITQTFMNLTLLPQFTEGLRMLGALQGEKAIIKAIKGLESSSKAEVMKSTELLYQAGLNPSQAAAWLNGDGTHKGGSVDTDYYRDHIKFASLALSEDIVVNPTASKKPLWHSNEHLKLVSQLKSFATVFSNGVMRDWYNDMTSGTGGQRAAMVSQVLPLVATYLAMQWYMAGLREFIRTGDTEDWDDATFLEATGTSVAYLGGAGLAQDSLHARQYGSTAVSALLGPAASDASKLVANINLAFSDPEKAMSNMMKMLTPSMPFSGPIDDIIESFWEQD